MLILSIFTFTSGYKTKNGNKIPVYAWESGPGNKSDTELLSEFKDMKSKGIDGLMYNAGISTPPSNPSPAFFCEAKTSLVRQSKECR